MPPVQFRNTEDDFLMIWVSIFILASSRFYFLHLVCAFREEKINQKKWNSLETPITQSFFFWGIVSMEDYTHLLITQFL